MSRDLSEAGTRLRDVVAGCSRRCSCAPGSPTPCRSCSPAPADPTDRHPGSTSVPGEPSEAARRVLYEVAVEAVGNVVKHAAATECVSVRREGGDWVLEVVDDGTGTEVDERTSDGFGLRAMRQRAVAGGGALELDSVPGRGTTVRLRVPDVAAFPAPGARAGARRARAAGAHPAERQRRVRRARHLVAVRLREPPGGRPVRHHAGPADRPGDLDAVPRGRGERLPPRVRAGGRRSSARRDRGVVRAGGALVPQPDPALARRADGLHRGRHRAPPARLAAGRHRRRLAGGPHLVRRPGRRPRPGAGGPRGAPRRSWPSAP